MKKVAAEKKVHKFGKPGAPIREEVYLYRKDIECVKIKDGVTGIGDRAFKKCANLREIRIPASVTSIGEFAFLKCSALESVTLPSTVKKVGAGAFAGFRDLEMVLVAHGLEIARASHFRGGREVEGNPAVLARMAGRRACFRFSNDWKNFSAFFQRLEKMFPIIGKLFRGRGSRGGKLLP